MNGAKSFVAPRPSKESERTPPSGPSTRRDCLSCVTETRGHSTRGGPTYGRGGFGRVFGTARSDNSFAVHAYDLLFAHGLLVLRCERWQFWTAVEPNIFE